MVATSEDVAQRAGVSRATVSQILNGRSAKFAEQTRDRVLQAAAELGYEPSAAGRTLARGSSDFVIAIVPDTTFGSNLQDLFETMTDDLARHGLTLVLRLASRTTDPLDRLVSAMRPAAVYSPAPLSDAEHALLKRRGVPAIDPISADGYDFNQEIGALQARYLIEHGHTRLAFAHLHDTRQDPFGHGRANGVRTACQAAGLPEPVIVQLGIDPAEAAAALDALDAPGVAVACYNDDVATALLSAATARGLRVPDDIALMGMDATPLSRVTLPPLTTVAYDLESAVNLSTHILLTRLGRESTAPDPTGPAIRIIEGGTV